MNDKLRVAVLLNDENISAWSFRMLEKIKEDACGEFVLIVKIKKGFKKEQSYFNKLWLNRRNILYSAFNRLDKKLHKNNPNAFESKNINNVISLDSSNTVNVELVGNLISLKDVENIKNFDVDILINLSSIVPDKNSVTIAKYGFWYLCSGDTNRIIGRPDGFWEVLNNWDETAISLHIVKDSPDDVVFLNNSSSLTHHTSPNRNRNSFYWKSLSFIPSKIKYLYEVGNIQFFKEVDTSNAVPYFYSNKLYTTPTNKEMLILGMQLFLKKIKTNISNRFFLDQWILLFHLNSKSKYSNYFFNYKKMLPPKDRFWADPFVLKRDNKYYIFLEELMYSNNKGYISLIVMDENGNYELPVKVLEKDYHLSYPFLIEENGELYMIPESSENRTIELYKCTNFPFKWELEKILMNDIEAVDSTVIFRDNKYWLFANVAENVGASTLDELHLFSSNSLLSDNWISHPKNPIISDVKRSRPAGNFFELNGKLYRPSQNCSKRYGYGMKINEVVEFNETDYKEIIVESILPNWDKALKATHTINNVDKLTIIDAIVRRRKFF